VFLHQICGEQAAYSRREASVSFVKEANMHQVDFHKSRICLLTVTLCALLTANAKADDDEATDSPATISVEGTPEVPGRRATLVGEPIDGGFVVIGGRFLPPPYRVSQRGREVLINDELFAILPGARDADGRDRPDRSRINPKQFVATLENHLARDEAIIAFDNRTRKITYVEDAAQLLDALVKAETVEERVHIAFEFEGESEGGTYRIPTAQWRQALAGFESTEGLIHFIEEQVGSQDDESGGEEVLFRDQRVDSSNRMYVLNVVGMLLVAVSMGILLTHRPPVNVRWSKIVDCEEANGLVVKCLALIVVLSVFDLISTLIAETMGGFEELNPFAESLVDSPLVLITFKFAATFLGIGLLSYRRRHVGAQQASWWLCLVLTLVIARWVGGHPVSILRVVVRGRTRTPVRPVDQLYSCCAGLFENSVWLL